MRRCLSAQNATVTATTAAQAVVQERPRKVSIRRTSEPSSADGRGVARGGGVEAVAWPVLAPAFDAGKMANE